MSRFASLKDLVCLVAGGAGSLGMPTVEYLVQKGAKAVVCDIDKRRMNAMASKLGDACTVVPADVTSESDMTAALKTCVERFGRLDVALNCAAIAYAIKTYNANKDRIHNQADYERLLHVNTVGSFNVARLASQLIAKNKADEGGVKGVIIFTAGIAAREGQLGQAGYAASKGAVVSMTLPMARDLAPEGIRVMTIAPGLMDSVLVPQHVSKEIQEYLHDLPLTPKGYGKPQVYAHCVESVICNATLNGETIWLDAGMREEFWYAHDSFQRSKQLQKKDSAKDSPDTLS